MVDTCEKPRKGLWNPEPKPEREESPHKLKIAKSVTKPVAYVSGPYRDVRGTYYVERNIRSAEAVAVRLWEMGYAVICPHTNTKHMDGAFPDSDKVFIDGDTEIVKRCDVVVVLQGWEKSEGTKLEMSAAHKAGVLVLHWARCDDYRDLSWMGREGKEAVAEVKRFRQYGGSE